jgi:uncharacterized protein
MRRLLVLIAAMTFGAAPAKAASFACARAHAPDERTICADRSLNDQDVRMATWLDVLSRIQLMGANGAMRDEQRAWLTRRHLCGADRICLARAYDRRLGDLMRNYDSWAAKFH